VVAPLPIEQQRASQTSRPLLARVSSALSESASAAPLVAEQQSTRLLVVADRANRGRRRAYARAR
jgi:hypothetical protein